MEKNHFLLNIVYDKIRRSVRFDVFGRDAQSIRCGTLRHQQIAQIQRLNAGYVHFRNATGQIGSQKFDTFYQTRWQLWIILATHMNVVGYTNAEWNEEIERKLK